MGFEPLTKCVPGREVERFRAIVRRWRRHAWSRGHGGGPCSSNLDVVYMWPMWIFVAIGAAVLVLAHTAPAPFLFDAIAGRRAVWHMPKRSPPTIHLTFDDGPNPTTTPDLLDVLARERVRATFFLIDRHITAATAPLVRRMFDEGHAVALHSHTRAYMLMGAGTFARTLQEAADHIEQVSGRRPCPAFRPHAGWRTWQMLLGPEEARLPPGGVGLDAVGLELVSRAHRRLGGQSRARPGVERRYRRPP